MTSYCLFVCLFVCLSVSLSVCLSVCLSLCALCSNGRRYQHDVLLRSTAHVSQIVLRFSSHCLTFFLPKFCPKVTHSVIYLVKQIAQSEFGRRHLMADFGRMVRHVLPPGEYDRRAMSPFAKLENRSGGFFDSHCSGLQWVHYYITFSVVSNLDEKWNDRINININVININIIVIILITCKNADVHLCSMIQPCWHSCLHCKSLTTWSRRIRPLLWWSYSTQAASCMWKSGTAIALHLMHNCFK